MQAVEPDAREPEEGVDEINEIDDDADEVMEEDKERDEAVPGENHFRSH